MMSRKVIAASSLAVANRIVGYRLLRLSPISEGAPTMDKTLLKHRHVLSNWHCLFVRFNILIHFNLN